MLRLSIILILIATPAIAQKVSVPLECSALATKNGFEQELDDKDAKRANKRLTWLRIRHPFNKEIKGCSEAIERMKKERGL